MAKILQIPRVQPGQAISHLSPRGAGRPSCMPVQPFQRSRDVPIARNPDFGIGLSRCRLS